MRGMRKLSAGSSRVFQPFQFNVSRVSWGPLTRLPHSSQGFHRRCFFHMRRGCFPGGFLLSFKWRKAWFQIIEVDHLPLTIFSWFPPLLLNAMSNMRQGLHNPPRTTPGLEKFPSSRHGSVFIPHPVSYKEPLTMALVVCNKLSEISVLAWGSASLVALSPLTTVFAEQHIWDISAPTLAEVPFRTSG